jgi:nitroreductase
MITLKTDRFYPNVIHTLHFSTSCSVQRSPSSFNLPPTQIILVESQELKDTLSEHAMMGPGNQFRVQQSSVVAVFLSDLEPTKRVNRIHQLEKDFRHPNYRASFPLSTSFLIGEGHAANLIKGIATNFMSSVSPMPEIDPVQAWSYKNMGLVAQTFVYAAESHGLATTMMEGFDPRRTRELLRIPDRYAIPLMVATGYEYEEEQQSTTEEQMTPRLDLSEVVFSETFGEPWTPTENRNEEAEADKIVSG